MDIEKPNFAIKSLGTPTFDNPIKLSSNGENLFVSDYIEDDTRLIFDLEVDRGIGQIQKNYVDAIERCGPRKKVFFDGASVHAAIVTCGGLCPGLNDVIRSIVMSLWHKYGVRKISGIPYGYMGLIEEYGMAPIPLTPDNVSDIHRKGGTILGSSRGNGDRIAEITSTLKKHNINMLFTIGGDGTQRGSLDISKELTRQGLPISVVGIPKTIDNDLSFSSKSFGFESAVAQAVESVVAAHTEAQGALNGVGLVKVMGRASGFIAAHTALAMNDVNFCLVPEVPFDLHGEKGLLYHLEKRLESRKHAVILVAEGAGQELMANLERTDASGNKKLNDIGVFLKKEITKHLSEKQMDFSVKYIDPSYIIRGTPANPNDSLFCARLGNCAVHAAMAGKTELVVNLLHDYYVHIPTSLAVSKRHQIDPTNSLWRDVVESTGQPALLKN